MNFSHKNFKMKKIIFSLVISALFFQGLAQIPAGYYNNATGTGYTLKTQLYNIIKGHYSVSYTPGVWNAFYTTDDRDDGFVWDMYSNCNYVFGDDQDSGTGGGSECDVYNREHSFPREWFGGEVSPMNTDIFHIYPTDKYLNGERASLPYGETSSPTDTYNNGTKKGPCSYPGYTSTIFEPIDMYKGDFARSYFYMATRYENIISSWPGSAMLDGSSNKCFSTWALNMLIEWNQSDTVSQKEIDRNNAVYEIQDNRNPYIDHPEWVECVWLNNCGVNIDNIAENNFTLSPNPATNYLYISGDKTISSIMVINILGQQITLLSNINEQNIELNIDQYNKGLYFIKIYDIKGFTTTEKFIKQ